VFAAEECMGVLVKAGVNEVEISRKSNESVLD